MVWRLDEDDMAGGVEAGVMAGSVRGHERRQVRANLASRLSRMQTAKATVSMGSWARESMAWTRSCDGTASGDAVDGIRLTRWTAGPGNVC